MNREKEQDKTAPSPKNNKNKLLIGWVSWLVFSILLVAITSPSILKSIEASGVLDLKAQSSVFVSSSAFRTVDACFVSYSGEFSLYKQKQKKLGGSVYHDCIESLLAGPDYNALAKGAITYIAPKTTLIGLTLSDGILFIDLSKEFLNSPDFAKAYKQLELTATDFSKVENIVLLVEGKEVTMQEGHQV
ncbi:GerMN domain-containing protein [uncultured Sphaerochaeta sp.]|uniref:GerMN domain-containing protein n=1 Tax=uncultured Sphaerochaeta sp. TaxID=886478 RepID=UPI002A0A6402|nr:GerMN domain-containing protein [uncultured Sphaerochaeta sp.]